MLPSKAVFLACIAQGIDEVTAEKVVSSFQRLANTKPTHSTAIEAMANRIRQHFDFTQPLSKRMTASQVWAAIDSGQATMGDLTLVGHALPKCTGKPGYRSNGKVIHLLPPQIGQP
jgi:hypothetical protein